MCKFLAALREGCPVQLYRQVKSWSEGRRMARPCTTSAHHASQVLDSRIPLPCAVTHAFMRSNMTHENKKPEAIGTPATKPEAGENILLNWIAMIVGLAAITLVAIYLPDFWVMSK